jgi:flagellar biosynthesis protein
MSEQPPEPFRATALSYDPDTPAPEVVATGTGAVAHRIVELAQAAGVPVRSDPALARALAALDLGDEVPEAMYRAVAAALAWAYTLDGSLTRPR